MVTVQTDKLVDLGDQIQATETTIFELEAAWRALDRMPGMALLTGEGREMARRAYHKQIEALSLEYDMAANDRSRTATA